MSGNTQDVDINKVLSNGQSKKTFLAGFTNRDKVIGDEKHWTVTACEAIIKEEKWFLSEKEFTRTKVRRCKRVPLSYYENLWAEFRH